ncbi:MAG TPA: imidazoleglycerol-phosphate dehydratase HisB [Actinomycetota bacterium]|nr:imidazoleglycerol-phosphate dehydratase HisB [Actinomycetota bacterium]
MTERTAVVERKTTETEIRVEVALDGGAVEISTGVPFFDHMLDQLGRHGTIGLTVDARGDLEIDAHHTIEDTGIALGQALTDALGDKAGIRRYGNALVPMEEALAEVALDISGRPLLVYECDIPAESIGQFDVGLTREFLQALARTAGLTLHVALRYGRDPHHCVEAIFKALARALSEAVSIDPRSGGGVPSTKGIL